MPTLRADAARSRTRILEAARARPVGDLRLNDVAHDAGVGVATVYRHFPTVHALMEAITAETVQRLLELSRDAAAEPDPWVAFDLYLRSVLALQLENEGLQPVLLSRADESDEVRSAKSEIFATSAAVLARAQDAGAVRPDLTLERMQHLVCGIEHAVRLGSPGDREPLTAILLAGVRPA